MQQPNRPGPTFHQMNVPRVSSIVMVVIFPFIQGLQKAVKVVSYYTRGAPFTECLFLYGRYIVKKYQWGLSDIDVYHVSIYLSRQLHRCSFIKQQTCLKGVYLTGSILLLQNEETAVNMNNALVEIKVQVQFFFSKLNVSIDETGFWYLNCHVARGKMSFNQTQKKYFGFLLKIRHN